MSPHKGGEGQVPFNGFDYADETGTVKSGNPMNVTMIVFTAEPPRAGATGGFGSDPLSAKDGFAFSGPAQGFAFSGPAQGFSFGEHNHALCPEEQVPPA